MTVPDSIEIKLKSVPGDIERAETQFWEEKDFNTLASNLSDIFLKLHLCLDRTQNKIWEKLNDKSDQSGKPNIYFPLAENEEKLILRLKKDQLGDLQTRSPGVYKCLASAQPFGGGHWWQKMYKLTKSRHERDAEIVPRVSQGIGIGRGQNLHIKSMRVGDGGEMELDATAWGMGSGSIEPVRIEMRNQEKIILQDVGTEAIPFANLCASETGKLIRKLFVALSQA